MEWMKVSDGYVRSDSIIDVHINHCYPQTIYFLLSSGDSVKYNDYDTPEEAKEELEKLVNQLSDLVN